MLNDISEQVLDLVRHRDPSHPIFQMPESTFDEWQFNNILEHQFDEKDTTEILECQCEVLFNYLKFKTKLVPIDNVSFPVNGSCHGDFSTYYLLNKVNPLNYFIYFQQ